MQEHVCHVYYSNRASILCIPPLVVGYLKLKMHLLVPVKIARHIFTVQKKIEEETKSLNQQEMEKNFCKTLQKLFSPLKQERDDASPLFFLLVVGLFLSLPFFFFFFFALARPLNTFRSKRVFFLSLLLREGRSELRRQGRPAKRRGGHFLKVD